MAIYIPVGGMGITWEAPMFWTPPQVEKFRTAPLWKVASNYTEYKVKFNKSDNDFGTWKSTHRIWIPHPGGDVRIVFKAQGTARVDGLFSSTDIIPFAITAQNLKPRSYLYIQGTVQPNGSCEVRIRDSTGYIVWGPQSLGIPKSDPDGGYIVVGDLALYTDHGINQFVITPLGFTSSFESADTASTQSVTTDRKAPLRRIQRYAPGIGNDQTFAI